MAINKTLKLSQQAVVKFAARFRLDESVPTNIANWTFAAVLTDGTTTIGVAGSAIDATTGKVTFTPTLTDLATLTAGDLTGEILYKVDGAGDAFTAGELTAKLREGKPWT